MGLWLGSNNDGGINYREGAAGRRESILKEFN
jgi:hypothetical protein